MITIFVVLLGCEAHTATRSSIATRSATATRTTANPDRPIEVVATVGMVADIVREVGGTRVAVSQLMGPGVDPHLYRGSRDDVRSILVADMVFYSGLMLEGKLTGMLKKVARKKPVVAITTSLSRDSVLEEGTAGHSDPHVWMDVLAWSSCVDVVADSLAEFDPANESQFRSAASAYQKTLAKLDKYGRQVMSTVPASGRVLITSHDAFHYFGRAYGLEVFGVQGLSTDSEAGLKQINSLVDTIVQRKIKAVFVESSVPKKSILAVVDGAGSRGHNVIIGGELFSDAMGPAATYEGTYVGMLDHNLTIVARSLGGDAPERGMQEALMLSANQTESEQREP